MTGKRLRYTVDANTKASVAEWESRFEMSSDPKAWARRLAFGGEKQGLSVVVKHRDLTERIGREERVDPKLLQAIMYVENDYFPDPPWGNPLPKTTASYLPMNVRQDLWGKLAAKCPEAASGATLADSPEMNIRTAARILSGIDDELVATPNETASERRARIASLYYSTRSGPMTSYGRVVQEAYDVKIAPLTRDIEIANPEIINPAWSAVPPASKSAPAPSR